PAVLEAARAVDPGARVGAQGRAAAGLALDLRTAPGGGRGRGPQLAAAAGRRDVAARPHERRVVGVPVGGEVAAGRGRGAEVVVAAAVVARGDRARDRRAVHLQRMCGARVLDVAHDIGALPAVAEARVLLALGLRRVRRAPLHGTERVRDLVQEALGPPATRARTG